MRSKDDYLNSLKDERKVYYRGSLVESVVDHPILRVTAEHASKLFSMAQRDYFDQELGYKVSRYFKLPLNSQDLLERQKLIYDTTVACNGIFNISQAIGSDAIFSLIQVGRKMQNEDYTSRISKYFDYIRKEDLTLAVAQTDVKGDRRKRPSEQQDKDMYVHVEEMSEDGIIVSGAKAHTTQSAVADEIIVIPTRAMSEKDKDYALSFALPAKTPGLSYIVRPIEEIEGNTMSVLSTKDYESETLTIFEHVKVPWERVFLCREYDYAGLLALNFVKYHRFTALSYRSATANIYLGTTSLIGKANGISEAPHIRSNIIDIIIYKELMRMSALAAASDPIQDQGLAVPNPLYTNIGKFYSNRNFSHILESLVDTAGGIIATMPAKEDLENPEEAAKIRKYLTASVTGEERIRILKIAKELVASSLAGYMMTLMIHAEGSLEASKLAILRDYDLAEPENMVQKILE